jgi:hypothetical protein
MNIDAMTAVIFGAWDFHRPPDFLYRYDGSAPCPLDSFADGHRRLP